MRVKVEVEFEALPMNAGRPVYSIEDMYDRACVTAAHYAAQRMLGLTEDGRNVQAGAVRVPVVGYETVLVRLVGPVEEVTL